MPVNLLLCEGVYQSPDRIILSRLLKGYCQIMPIGSKRNMLNQIEVRRRESSSKIYGLQDRDFVKDWEIPTNQPKTWTHRGTHQLLGWYWERKEIENYLVDPDVVSKALGNKMPPDYIALLEKASDKIWHYQAARTALSNCYKYFQPLKISFGKKRGKENYPFPESFTDAACRQGIEETVNSHLSKNKLVEKNEVLETYQNLLNEFDIGGIRRQYFLHTFSGKDLLWAMDEALKSLGGAINFRERVLVGIEESSEDIGTWLPEWQRLRQIIQNIV
jgi:hypothetical protein